MHASDHPTTGLYLRGLLAAGARPFAPPSGVYRLLGQAPPQRATVRFPPPLPPVGFVYEGPEHLGPGTARPAQPVARGQEQAGDGAASHPGPHRTMEPPPAPELTQPADRPQGGRTSSGGERAASPNVAPRAPEPVLPFVPSVRGKPERAGEEPPGDSASAGQTSVQEGTAADIRTAEKHTGLAIPGLTQRRALFAALGGALPREEPDGAPSASGTRAPADAPSRLISGSPSAEWPSPSPTLRPSGAIRAAARPVSPSLAEAGAAFRARLRVADEVEHVRRAVAAQDAQTERVAPEAVREAAREAMREAVQEERKGRRGEERPDRSGEPPPSPVVVVQRVEGAERRAPRAFWSSSALRSSHLRMLR